jgi:hypothetical protein
MARTPVVTKKTTVVKKKPVAKRAQATKATNKSNEKQKNYFEQTYGEGTAFDLDYGKLLIIALCIYIAVKVS